MLSHKRSHLYGQGDLCTEATCERGTKLEFLASLPTCFMDEFKGNGCLDRGRSMGGSQVLCVYRQTLRPGISPCTAAAIKSKGLRVYGIDTR